MKAATVDTGASRGLLLSGGAQRSRTPGAPTVEDSGYQRSERSRILFPDCEKVWLDELRQRQAEEILDLFSNQRC